MKHGLMDAMLVTLHKERRYLQRLARTGYANFTAEEEKRLEFVLASIDTLELLEATGVMEKP